MACDNNSPNVNNNGDTFKWSIKVENTSIINIPGITVALIIPAGIGLNGPIVPLSTAIDVPVGAYNNTNDIWHIGDLDIGESTDEMEFEFIVNDIDQAVDDEFIIQASLGSSCTEGAGYDLTVNVNCDPANLVLEGNTQQTTATLNLTGNNTNQVNLTLK
jgi:hypothetical protein